LGLTQKKMIKRQESVAADESPDRNPVPSLKDLQKRKKMHFTKEGRAPPELDQKKEVYYRKPEMEGLRIRRQGSSHLAKGGAAIGLAVNVGENQENLGRKVVTSKGKNRRRPEGTTGSVSAPKDESRKMPSPDERWRRRAIDFP